MEITGQRPYVELNNIVLPDFGAIMEFVTKVVDRKEKLADRIIMMVVQEVPVVVPYPASLNLLKQ